MLKPTSPLGDTSTYALPPKSCDTGVTQNSVDNSDPADSLRFRCSNWHVDPFCHSILLEFPNSQDGAHIYWANTRLVQSCGPKITRPTMINSRAVRALYSYPSTSLSAGRGTWPRPNTIVGSTASTEKVTHGCMEKRVGGACSRGVVLEDRHNLLDTDSFPFHDILLPHLGSTYAGNAPSRWPRNRGADHLLRPPNGIRRRPHRRRCDHSTPAPQRSPFVHGRYGTADRDGLSLRCWCAFSRWETR